MKPVCRLVASLLVAGMLLTHSRARADDNDSPSLELAPWIFAGVGAATVAAGGVFAFLASQSYSDAEEDPVHRSAADSLEQGDAFVTLANTLLISGAAVVVIGITWGLVELKESADDNRASVRLEFGPASLRLRGSF